MQWTGYNRQFLRKKEKKLLNQNETVEISGIQNQEIRLGEFDNHRIPR